MKILYTCFQIVDKYMDKFKTLTYPLTPKVPYINIIMIGETGSGKSSCLNTFATALSGCEERIYVCRESPEQGKEKSATKRVLFNKGCSKITFD